MLLSFVLEMDNADAVDDVQLALESFTSVVTACQAARVAAAELRLQLTFVVARPGHPVVDRELLPMAQGSGVFEDIGLVVAPNTTYYEKKMVGALKSAGEVIAYIDSDVTYAADWLIRMLGAFEDGECDVAYGCTYARMGSREENAAAVVWQFALDDARDPRRANTAMIWSNNWFVRRDFLVANPLPRVSGDLKLEGSYWDRLVRDRGARVRHIETVAVHVQPATVGEVLALGRRSGRSYVVGFRRDGQPLRGLLYQWVRHNGIRTLVDRVRRLRSTSGPRIEFSLPRVALLHGSWLVGLGVGIAIEALHPRRPVSFDYSTLESGLSRV